MQPDKFSIVRDGLDDGPPLPASVVAAWRDGEICRHRDDGMTLREIAARYSISHETVRYRLRKCGRR